MQKEGIISFVLTVAAIVSATFVVRMIDAVVGLF